MLQRVGPGGAKDLFSWGENAQEAREKAQRNEKALKIWKRLDSDGYDMIRQLQKRAEVKAFEMTKINKKAPGELLEYLCPGYLDRDFKVLKQQLIAKDIAFDVFHDAVEHSDEDSRMLRGLWREAFVTESWVICVIQ